MSPPSAHQKAGEADWAEVHAIALEYAPKLKKLEIDRDRIKKEHPVSRLNVRESVKRSCYGLAYDMADKAIRDLGREMWARMGEYLSPYELREYKLEHSQLAREMRPELEWFQPSKGEFVALYTYKDKKADFLDEMFGGDTKLYSCAYRFAFDREMTIQREVDKAGRTRRALEESRQRMDVDTRRMELGLQAMARKTMERDRWESFMFGSYVQKRKDAMDELERQDRLHSQSQILVWYSLKSLAINLMGIALAMMR